MRRRRRTGSAERPVNRWFLGAAGALVVAAGCSDDPDTIDATVHQEQGHLVVELDETLSGGSLFYTRVDGELYSLTPGTEQEEASYAPVESRHFRTLEGRLWTRFTLVLPPDASGQRLLVCSESDMTGECFHVDA